MVDGKLSPKFSLFCFLYIFAEKNMDPSKLRFRPHFRPLFIF